MFSNPKNSEKLCDYSCEKCDFNTCNKNDYNRHIKTKKHISNGLPSFSMEKTQKNSYTCDCGKTYKDNSGLWRHKKQCTYQDSKMETTNVAHSDEINELKEFMKYLMQENSEMKSMMMEVIKNGTISNTNSHNTNNSHNKAAL